jgi:hypothetical protein
VFPRPGRSRGDHRALARRHRAGAAGARPTRGKRGPDERRCGSGEPLDRLAVGRPGRSTRPCASSPSRALHCSSRPAASPAPPSSAAARHRRTALLPSTPLGSRGWRLGIPQTRTRLPRAEGVARATRPHPRRTRITRLSGADDTEAAMKFPFNDESSLLRRCGRPHAHPLKGIPQ